MDAPGASAGPSAGASPRRFLLLLGGIAVAGAVALSGAVAKSRRDAESARRAHVLTTLDGVQVEDGHGQRLPVTPDGGGVVLVVSTTCPHCHAVLRAMAAQLAASAPTSASAPASTAPAAAPAALPSLRLMVPVSCLHCRSASAPVCLHCSAPSEVACLHCDSASPTPLPHLRLVVLQSVPEGEAMLDSLGVRVPVTTVAGERSAFITALRLVGTPTFIAVDAHGREQRRLVGEPSASDLASWIAAAR